MHGPLQLPANKREPHPEGLAGNAQFLSFGQTRNQTEQGLKGQGVLSCHHGCEGKKVFEQPKMLEICHESCFRKLSFASSCVSKPSQKLLHFFSIEYGFGREKNVTLPSQSKGRF